LFFNHYTSLSLIIYIFTLPIKLRAYTLYLFCTNQLRSYMCICTTVLPPPPVWRLLYYRCAEFLTVPDVVGSPYTNKHIKQSIIVSFFCIHILCCFDLIIMPHQFTSIYQDQPVLVSIRRDIRRSLDWVGKSDEFLYSAWTL